MEAKNFMKKCIFLISVVLCFSYDAGAQVTKRGKEIVSQKISEIKVEELSDANVRDSKTFEYLNDKHTGVQWEAVRKLKPHIQDTKVAKRMFSLIQKGDRGVRKSAVCNLSLLPYDWPKSKGAFPLDNKEQVYLSKLIEEKVIDWRLHYCLPKSYYTRDYSVRQALLKDYKKKSNTKVSAGVISEILVVNETARIEFTNYILNDSFISRSSDGFITLKSLKKEGYIDVVEALGDVRLIQSVDSVEEALLAALKKNNARIIDAASSSLSKGYDMHEKASMLLLGHLSSEKEEIRYEALSSLTNDFETYKILEHQLDSWEPLFEMISADRASIRSMSMEVLSKIIEFCDESDSYMEGHGVEAWAKTLYQRLKGSLMEVAENDLNERNRKQAKSMLTCSS